MKRQRQPNRLPADAPHNFGGRIIDRSKPLSFRLNGRRYEAFGGDTVLSALLAAGVGAAGTLNGAPTALDERLAPVVAPWRTRSDPATWLPMDRRAVRGGEDLATISPRRGLWRWIPPFGRLGHGSLGLRLRERALVDPAWSGLLPAAAEEVDTVVVGGGIAGMSAALAAARAGDRVALVEQRPTLGGDACFFGRVGDEEAPDARITGLSARIADNDAIRVYTCAEALALSGTRVLVHAAQAGDSDLGGRLVRLAAGRVILATGSAERLPVFAGNRLPGVLGAIAAFRLAEHYGVWLGRTALIATPQNFGYRLALLAGDAGVEIRRVVDPRPAPQSRFVDFAKATGITLASGLLVSGAEPRRGRRLGVSFAVAIEEAAGESEPIETDLLIAAGGFQPRIGLWMMAGGQAFYDRTARALVATGAPADVRLAGAAAGYTSSAACVASAERAVDDLLGRPTEPVEDKLVDAIYETPAAPTSVAPPRAGGAPAYLDGGTSFTLRRMSMERGAMAPTPRQFSPLSVADVAAAVDVGAVPAGEAGIVAEERCLRGSAEIFDTGWRPPRRAQKRAGSAAVPSYLVGRFGPNAVVRKIAADDGRRLEPGCLLYAGSEAGDPSEAIGVVLGADPDGKRVRVLGSRAAIANAPLLFVRDISGPVPVSLARPASRRKEPQAA